MSITELKRLETGIGFFLSELKNAGFTNLDTVLQVVEKEI